MSVRAQSCMSNAQMFNAMTKFHGCAQTHMCVHNWKMIEYLSRVHLFKRVHTGNLDRVVALYDCGRWLCSLHNSTHNSIKLGPPRWSDLRTQDPAAKPAPTLVASASQCLPVRVPEVGPSVVELQLGKEADDSIAL